MTWIALVEAVLKARLADKKREKGMVARVGVLKMCVHVSCPCASTSIIDGDNADHGVDRACL